MFIVLMIIRLVSDSYLYRMSSNKVILPTIGLILSVIFLNASIKMWEILSGIHKFLVSFMCILISYFMLTYIFDIVIYFK